VLPSWVMHQDGRRTPFDADVLSSHLFAAAQSLGPADAFLVRELTDGVLHFLAQEDLGETAPAQRIDEITEKIVRELGQPTLAAAFANRRPAASLERRAPLTMDFAADEDPEVFADRCVEAFARRSVFAPDIAAAHEQGLIHLGGLRSPRLLQAIVLEPAAATADPFDAAWELVVNGAQRAARHLALDGPEWMIADDAVGTFVRGLDRAAEAAGRSVDVHINAATPPPWAEPRGAGPLFDALPDAPTSSPSRWLTALSEAATRLRFVWHWRNEPTIDAPFVRWLAQAPARWSTIFDRPNQPIALGQGLSRRRPGISIAVGLDLPRLLNRPDVSCQGDVFLEKLPSLTRLAVSAGCQKRAYLRRHANALARAFLVDRAAVRLEPVGVGAVLQQLLGVAAPTTKPARVFVRKILLALHSPLADCRIRTGLDIVLDAPVLLPIDAAQGEPFLEYEEMRRGAVTAECDRWLIGGARPAEGWSDLLSVVWRKTAAGGVDRVLMER
jgi:hypothetical protein